MKSLLYLSLLLQLLFYLHAVRAGPIVISNDDDALEDVEIDDEFTTQTVERLSSAATCLVASVEYTHGQQIYRADPCEFCLCLDGEMFCWWQDCPPAMEGPCKDKRPFTSCQASENENSIDNSPHLQQAAAAAQDRRDTPVAVNTTNPTSAPATSSPIAPSSSQTVQTNTSNQTLENSETLSVNDNNIRNGVGEQVSTVSESVLSSVDVTTVTPKRCLIMGRSYNIGDQLPHTTGNCVECICGAGAQIVCSPYQCAPSIDDINDYRPAGLRAAQPDVF